MSANISVIITCYNLEGYIRAAIDSVLAQGFRNLVEILVVDDCSLDDSAAIIKSFPQVRYIKTETNSGVLLATLAGIEASVCDLIFFLDGDDVWEKGKLAACVEAFESNADCALVTHDLSFIDGSGWPLERSSRPGEVLTPLTPVERSVMIRNGILHLGDYVWLGSALAIRKSLSELEKFAGWVRALSDPANTYQDWPLAFWIAADPRVTCEYVPQTLLRYRLHGANHSGDARNSERALRNLKRVRNTVSAMLLIAAEQGLPASVERTLRRRIGNCDYLIDLYSDRNIKSLIGFVRSVPDFIRQGKGIKEFLRFAAIILLGARRFASLASRRHLF